MLRSRLEEALSWVKLLQDNCNTLKEELERKEVYCESLKKKVEQLSEQGKLTDQVKASKQVNFLKIASIIITALCKGT